MSLAIVFGGQGSQHAAMLPWLEDAPELDGMRGLLRQQDWRAAMADAAWATSNARAQVLITATALAAWTQLRGLLPEPVGMAGYSVGELAAFSAAGVFDGLAAVRLAATRAALMDDAGRATAGGLCGVTGLPRAALLPLLQGTPAEIAIANGEDSVVLGGPLAALDALATVLAGLGARVTTLPVAVASHTTAMQAAALAFRDHLAAVPMQSPRSPLFSNTLDRVWTTSQAREALARQIATTVRWDDCMDQLAQRAPRCVLEIGGGQALSRLWQQRHPHIPSRSADEFRSARGIADWVARCTSG
jgi:[acyl-carrier-protein] S-malonyltransferase